LRVLVTGSGGQVGRGVVRQAPEAWEVVAVTHTDLDIADGSAVREVVRNCAPDVIINAAAYTAVDRAESEPDLARRVNADGPYVLAQAAKNCGARLIHISTDFVFDGSSSVPYRVDAVPAPMSVYGRTKLDGEIGVQSVPGVSAAIIRTAWVYDSTGRNFLVTMLRLMREHGRVRVVDDQIGSPTSASSVADAIWRLVGQTRTGGMFHWTDAGVASWYDFAVAIAEEAASCGLLPAGIAVEPIATSDYPTSARRPAYSVLDRHSTGAALGLTPVHWRRRLRSVLGEIARA
jgi:dTDP-4-dehydrorhamnose reductase